MTQHNDDGSKITTYFAPAARASYEEIRALHDSFCKDTSAVSILEALPDPAVLLSEQRQIVAANRAVLGVLGVDDPSKVLGLRPGEALGCCRADEMPGGCGTSKSCSVCGAVKAIQGCVSLKDVVEEECRIVTRSQADGGALDLLIHAAWLSLAGGNYVFVAMRDIGAEKRRGVLERVFFHDVLNTASGIRNIADMMHDHPDVVAADEQRYRQDLSRMSEQIVEEISGQRALLAAERGELLLRLTEVSVRDIFDEVVSLYRHHNSVRGRSLVLGQTTDRSIVTDKMLLRRSLSNLVNNALEAARSGEVVTISTSETPDSIVFAVTNPGVMPEHVQRQVFQRSFSTKDGLGRGVGTYSVRLFVERYLNGAVAFTSRESDGTTFTVTLPKS